jgi:pyruvate kinase
MKKAKQRLKIKDKALILLETLNGLQGKLSEYELRYKDEISKVHPAYKKSARNLVHYLAASSFDLESLHKSCGEIGITGFENFEAHVAKSLLVNIDLLCIMLNMDKRPKPKNILSRKQSLKRLNKHTKLLFGYKSRKRRTRIMVTMPDTAAEDYKFVRTLVKTGMNSARINCAHDGPENWLKIITNIRKANKRLNRHCKIIMDLSGPKLRTGAIKAGPEVIHVKPVKNDLGQVIIPAKIWIGVPDDKTPTSDVLVIPVIKEDLNKLKKDDLLIFSDSRGKTCKILIGTKEGTGRLATCKDSSYVTSGMAMQIKRDRKKTGEKIQVGLLTAIERNIVLNIGDEIRIHANAQLGESAIMGDEGMRMAHISCTLPQVFPDVEVGQNVFFDDGKIGGVITACSSQEILVKITQAKKKGSKLKAQKGINFPDSDLSIQGLTEKDKEDLEFICFQADAVNLSFVNNKKDVQDAIDVLNQCNSNIGLILKIETKKGLKNMPEIILKGMQTYPIGLLIARGDLAVEAGWKSMAQAQKDILNMSKAAHIPSIWATQVLETYAKKGIPSRAELTDALQGSQSECIMLNKGPYIVETLKLLGRILQGS